MANKNAVWGIDIGQCALKALRCTIGDDGESIVADKYDYIEYPKILSQPEADPEELIREALKEFLSRNEVLGDKVAISVSGQAGLSRFFKPPPVEAKTLPDIVKYEVKQQIPFPIEDVIWDWQQLGGTIVDGRTIDAEVGLFAMKREAVYRALRPFDDIDVEVDMVQLSPLAIYNVLCNDILEEIPNPEEFDPEDPPESMVVMSMGTDTTDLIVSNGIKLWLRNIPIGGNHFTKQLSRELKLTHAKAEHLKRNARQAENPKVIFKAMRPVFNDLVNEVQRSLTFFQSMDKTAVISKIVLLGNAAKLPGLRQFLNKQLELDIAKVSAFEKIQGEEVLSQKTFSENVLSYAPSYGLCLQGLNKAQLNTNLLPDEIVTERIIRAKKPWVLASVGLLMLGCLLGYFFKETAWRHVHPENEIEGVAWDTALSKVKTLVSKSGQFVEEDSQKKSFLDRINLLSNEVTSSADNTSTWLEVRSAIYQALPKDEELLKLIREEMELGENEPLVDPSVSPSAYPFDKRKEIFIEYMETKYEKDLSTWWTKVEPIYKNQYKQYEIDAGTDAETDKTAKGSAAKSVDDPLSDTPGWIIEIKGYHFRNSDQEMLALKAGDVYVIENFIEKIDTRRKASKTVKFPEVAGVDPSISGAGEYKFEDFGIYYPTIVRDDPIYEAKIEFTEQVTEFNNDEEGKEDPGGTDSAESDNKDDAKDEKAVSDTAPVVTEFKVQRYDFTLQMAWIPRSPTERYNARKARQEAEDADGNEPDEKQKENKDGLTSTKDEN